MNEDYVDVLGFVGEGLDLAEIMILPWSGFWDERAPVNFKCLIFELSLPISQVPDGTRPSFCA